MAFVISANAVDKSENFQQMKDIINRMVLKYGTKMIRYSLIVFGEYPVIYQRLVEISFLRRQLLCIGYLCSLDPQYREMTAEKPK